MVWYWSILPMLFRSIHRHWDNHTNALVPMKQPWGLWLYRVNQFATNSWNNHNKTNHNKPNGYFMRHAVCRGPCDPCEIRMKLWIMNFRANFTGWGLRYLLWYCPEVTGHYWWQVTIVSGNGLVPSGNKPLPEAMLTQIYVATWCH